MGFRFLSTVPFLLVLAPQIHAQATFGGWVADPEDVFMLGDVGACCGSVEVLAPNQVRLEVRTEVQDDANSTGGLCTAVSIATGFITVPPGSPVREIEIQCDLNGALIVGAANDSNDGADALGFVEVAGILGSSGQRSLTGVAGVDLLSLNDSGRVCLPPGLHEVRVKLISTARISDGQIAVNQANVKGGATRSYTVTLNDVGMCGGVGANYCNAIVNSTGLAARIMAWGDTAVSKNKIALTADRIPANVFGYFIASKAQASIPSGQGVICVGGPFGRFRSQVQQSGPAGKMGIPVDLMEIPILGAAVAGDTINFQCWFREGPTWNFSDAIAINFI